MKDDIVMIRLSIILGVSSRSTGAWNTRVLRNGVCSYIHEVVELLAGAPQAQRRRPGGETVSVAAAEGVGPVLAQKVSQHAIGAQLRANGAPPL